MREARMQTRQPRANGSQVNTHERVRASATDVRRARQARGHPHGKTEAKSVRSSHVRIGIGPDNKKLAGISACRSVNSLHLTRNPFHRVKLLTRSKSRFTGVEPQHPGGVRTRRHQIEDFKKTHHSRRKTETRLARETPPRETPGHGANDRGVHDRLPRDAFPIEATSVSKRSHNASSRSTTVGTGSCTA